MNAQIPQKFADVVDLDHGQRSPLLRFLTDVYVYEDGTLATASEVIDNTLGRHIDVDEMERHRQLHGAIVELAGGSASREDQYRKQRVEAIRYILGAGLTITQCARYLNVSAADVIYTLAREKGVDTVAYLTAEDLLRTTTMSYAAIAERCGFGWRRVKLLADTIGCARNTKEAGAGWKHTKEFRTALWGKRCEGLSYGKLAVWAEAETGNRFTVNQVVSICRQMEKREAVK